MFIGYRIRPVLEWEGSDESRELKAFSSIHEATEAKSALLRDHPDPDVEPRILWTLYGLNPVVNGVTTEEAIADRDSEASATELLEKLVGTFRSNAEAITPHLYAVSKQKPPTTADRRFIDVTLEFKVDLVLLRKRKRALIGVYEGVPVSAEQEDAAEGMLNMLDDIQDSILEQGLASEDEIFARGPSLFEAAA